MTCPVPSPLLSPNATAAALPWQPLADEIAALVRDDSVRVPQRIVMPLAGGAHFFAMPAADARVAIAKLVTLTPSNQGTPRPAIQGDVVAFDVATGERRLILDGPTVTARRTAAVSLLAAQRLACNTQGPLLIVGAGVQALAHLQAFVQCLGVREVFIAARREASARPLIDAAAALGATARYTASADEAAAHCPLIATCTPAGAIVLREAPRADAFIAAVGAYQPHMAELDAPLVQRLAREGAVVVDTEDAAHEAGDLLQAGLDVPRLPTLATVVHDAWPRQRGPVLFKNCGWGGWDLAAARLAMAGVAGQR